MRVKTKQFHADRRCIYCGSRSVTLEDYFGRGVRKLLNPRENKRRHQGSAGFEVLPNGMVPITTGGKWKSGAVVSGKLKIACRACNGGWMSGIQSNVLPVLKNRIRNLESFSPLAPHERNALAAWVAMVVMSYEFKHLPTQVVSQGERDILRIDRKPPENWSICIGRYSGSQETAISHFAWYEFIQNDSTLADIPDPAKIKPSVQCTTFVLGNLLFHAYSASPLVVSRQVEIDEMARLFGLCRLTRDSSEAVYIERVLDDYSADRIAEYLLPPSPIRHRSLTRLHSSEV